MQNSPKDFSFFFLHPYASLSPSLLYALLYHTPSMLVLLAYQGIDFIQLGEAHYCPEAAAHTKLCAGDSSVQKAVSLWSVLWNSGERDLLGKGAQGLYAADRHTPSTPLWKGTKSVTV